MALGGPTAWNWRLIRDVTVGAVALLALVAWTRSRENQARAEERDRALQESQRQHAEQDRNLATAVVQLADTVKGIQADEQRRLAVINQRLDKAQTPQDFSALVTELMKLPKPVQVVTPPATAENPRPTPVAVVPVEDQPRVQAYVRECEDCKISRDSLAQQLQAAKDQALGVGQRLALRDLDLKDMTASRDQWKKTATGGSWLQRAGRAVLYAGCAAAGGAAGGAAKNAPAAAIGASAAVVACAILNR